MINELIEQIGGRERLQEIYADGFLKHGESKLMASALLAVLDVKPLGYIDPESMREYRGVLAGGSWSSTPRTGEYNQTMPIYTNPPAASAPDGLASAVNRLLDSDGSRGTFSAIRRGDALAEVERLLAAAPSPGGDGG